MPSMPRNTINFMSLAALLLLGGARLAGPRRRAAGRAQPVMLNQASIASLPVVDRVVVRKGERRLLLMHGGNVVRSYHVALGLNPRRPEGALGRLPHSRRHATGSSAAIRAATTSSRSRCPTRTPRTCKRARARHWDSGGSIMIHGLPNLLEARPRVLRHARLDRWLHRGVQRRHGGDLDARRRTTCRSTSSRKASEQRVFRIRRRARRSARQSREPFAGRDRQAARHRPGRPVPAVPPLRAGGAQLRRRPPTTPRRSSTATATSTSASCATPAA